MTAAPLTAERNMHMTDASEREGIWNTRGEKVAFGLYCAYFADGATSIDLTDACDVLTVDELEVRLGFQSLADRRILTMFQDGGIGGNVLLRRGAEAPGKLCSPRDYYHAVRALHAVTLEVFRVDQA